MIGKLLFKSAMIKDFCKIYPFVRPYRWIALFAILITIPVGSLDAVIAWALKPYMDVVLIEKSVRSASYVPILIIVFSLIQSILNFTSTYVNAWVGAKITNDVQDSLYIKMIHNDVAFFDKNTSGNIIFRYYSDASAACAGLVNNIRLFTTRFFSSIALICVLFYNSWQLTIVALIFMFAAFIPLSKVRKKLQELMSKSVASTAFMNTQYNEAFHGNRVVASYNLYEKRHSIFKETLEQLFRLNLKMIKRTGFVSPMMHFFIASGIAFVVWYGSHLIVTEQMTAGNFVSFIAALLMLYTPVKTIGNTYNAVQFALLAMERIFEALEDRPRIVNSSDAVKLDNKIENIEYENVWFAYDEDKYVLEDVSLKIQSGKKIAFVGNSGGGKTTFANLLTRFYDVSKGEIRINGINIKDIDLASLRDKIAVVFQDNFLFGGTIRENIMLGNQTATEEDLQKAIKNSCLEEFVNSLENGLETQIGEQGILLSGGQKQRIGIARAFIKNAPIVILDEATSALDNQSEAVVQQAIENLMVDRTVLIIAHRLSTIKNADNIVVINKGKIVETGTHEELVNKENGMYKRLYETQIV
jgi:subfamily B ATP-binding cassette protein MsbA